MIERFLRYISQELGYSVHTIEAYRRDLGDWADFATGGKPGQLVPGDVTEGDVRQWVASVASSASARTVKRKVSSLRAFYRFLMREGAVASNPALHLRLPKVPKALPVNIRPEETRAILSDESSSCHASTEPGSVARFHEMRDRLILDILYNTGMRCSELIGLKDADVSTSGGELKVLGKRNKERVIPFGPELAAAIEDYRLVRDSMPLTAVSARDADAPLMVRDNGEPLYRKMVYNVVHRLLSEGGAHAARLSPHVMRHSMATDMLNGGAPLASVQQLLGHASLTSTQVYTHVTFRDLKNNYQSAHPRALNNKGGHYGH